MTLIISVALFFVLAAIIFPFLKGLKSINIIFDDLDGG